MSLILSRSQLLSRPNNTITTLPPLLLSLSRRYITNNNRDITPIFTNRNPRNLERMRIAYKPDGFHLDRPGKCFWHQLTLSVSGRHATATVNHFENGVVVRASTSEWAIKKQLYRYKDTAAYINLARVLADRCLKSGLTEIACSIQPPRDDGKVALFLRALEEGGVRLGEPPQYKPAQPWDLERPEKPWEVVGDEK